MLINSDEFYIKWLKNLKNKNGIKARRFKKLVEISISQYRFTGLKSKNSTIKKYCYKEADRLEIALRLAIGYKK